MNIVAQHKDAIGIKGFFKLLMSFSIQPKFIYYVLLLLTKFLTSVCFQVSV